MRNSLARAIVAVQLFGLAACMSEPFVRTDGPARGRGISVALVSQSCDRENDPNWSYADILGLDVKISVANSGAGAITFDPAQTALSAGGRSQPPRRSDAAAAIPPGASRTFVVHFLERNGRPRLQRPHGVVTRPGRQAGRSTRYPPADLVPGQ